MWLVGLTVGLCLMIGFDCECGVAFVFNNVAIVLSLGWFGLL